jgi:hypothetical protein
MDWVRDTTLLGEKPAGRSFFSTPDFLKIPPNAPLLPHIPERVIKSLITSPFNASSLLYVSVPSCTATFSSLIKASFVTTVLI